jgi:DNA-binding FadR family transcriptional regulator
VDSPDVPPEREPLLDDRAVEAIARRVSQLLRHDAVVAGHERLVSAAEIARRFGVSRAGVYENADRLGAVRLGRGARPRLRFDPQEVEKRLDTAHQGASPPPRRPPGDHGSIADADLIPLREL